MNSFTNVIEHVVLKELPESELEIKGEIPFELILPYQEKALKDIAAHITLPGFRKGHVPFDVAKKHVGELAVLEEAVELCIKDFYPELLLSKKIDAVGKPTVRFTKLAPGNPVELTIQTAVYPSVNIPDNWKTLQEKVPPADETPATDEDVQKALSTLQESKKVKKEDGSEELPELNDAFAQSFGADTVEAFKIQILESLSAEKARHTKDARRNKIVDMLLEKSSVTVPAIFIESELDKIVYQMRQDITRMGLTFEAYLGHSKKTEEQVREEFKDQATKRAKLQLVLNKIAQEEKVEVEEQAVAEEVRHAMEHFPDARQELVRVHVETVLQNEKVLQLLESGGKRE